MPAFFVFAFLSPAEIAEIAEMASHGEALLWLLDSVEK
jgi:hypothetical protein